MAKTDELSAPVLDAPGDSAGRGRRCPGGSRLPRADHARAARFVMIDQPLNQLEERQEARYICVVLACYAVVAAAFALVVVFHL